MIMTKSLGDVLRENAVIKQQKKEDAEFKRIEYEKSEKVRKRNTIEKFFNDTKKRIEKNILSGGSEIRIVCKRNNNKEFQYKTMKVSADNTLVISQGEYAGIVEEFMEWIDSNGLVASFHYCHDGMGMESWTELVVVPK